MTLPLLAVLAGLALLVWSADRFVDGAAATANHLGMPSLLIGMVVIGFGTSAPEMVVSALASIQGNPGLALGNAYGSNIANVGLILGVTAVLSPIAVHSSILRKELPMLLAVTVLAAALLWDLTLSRSDGFLHLGVFALLMGWTIYQGMRPSPDPLAREVEAEVKSHAMPLRPALVWLVIGLVVLIASSRLLVWGAVAVAQSFGVSDLVIGLTIVAVGTSLPELASSLAAVRKSEHDMALGNVIGSNLFNTLAVVGIAGSIHPLAVDAEVLSRDILAMAVLTVVLCVFCYGFRGPGRITRLEGVLLLAGYIGYNLYLVGTTLAA